MSVKTVLCMREFILVDLESQIEYLPAEIRRHPRERFLDWLRLYGEVWEVERDHRQDAHDYGFQSRVGLLAVFTLTDDGRIWLRGRSSSLWLRFDGPRYARFRRLAETSPVAKAIPE